MPYFIMILTDWEFDRSVLFQHLKSRWPNIQVNLVDVPESGHLLNWTLYKEQKRLVIGRLLNTREIIVLEGEIDSIVEFAIWCRSVAPQNESMVFFDEQYSFEAKISLTTTEKDLLEKIHHRLV